MEKEKKSLTPVRFKPTTSGTDHRCSTMQLSYNVSLTNETVSETPSNQFHIFAIPNKVLSLKYFNIWYQVRLIFYSYFFILTPAASWVAAVASGLALASLGAGTATTFVISTTYKSHGRFRHTRPRASVNIPRINRLNRNESRPFVT